MQAGAASGGDTLTMTQPGTIRGTLQYMAPEQLEGRGADARSDIFALGAVLYEMALGQPALDEAARRAWLRQFCGLTSRR
jgi:serine/threonine protein kinase